MLYLIINIFHLSHKESEGFHSTDNIPLHLLTINCETPDVLNVAQELLLCYGFHSEFTPKTIQ
jgi:hypothetical protein